MNFRTAYDRGDRAISPSGSRFKATFVREINVDGVKSLKRGTDENVYQLIQIAAHGTLVSDLIARANNGDTTAIMPSEGVITDLTKMPTSLLEAHNKICLARRTYEALPAEVRQSFGNSFTSFMNAVQDGTFTKDYKLTPKKAVTQPSAELQKLDEIKKLLEGGTQK